MSTIKLKYGELIPTQVIDSFAPSNDILFRFEFDECYFINSFVVRSDTFSKVIEQITLVLGDSIMDHVISIHKIY